MSTLNHNPTHASTHSLHAGQEKRGSTPPAFVCRGTSLIAPPPPGSMVVLWWWMFLTSEVPLYPACSVLLEAAASSPLAREQGVGGVLQTQPHRLFVDPQPQHRPLLGRCCPAFPGPRALTSDLIGGFLFLSFKTHSLCLSHNLSFFVCVSPPLSFAQSDV